MSGELKGQILKALQAGQELLITIWYGLTSLLSYWTRKQKLSFPKWWKNPGHVIKITSLQTAPVSQSLCEDFQTLTALVNNEDKQDDLGPKIKVTNTLPSFFKPQTSNHSDSTMETNPFMANRRMRWYDSKKFKKTFFGVRLTSTSCFLLVGIEWTPSSEGHPELAQ